MKNLKSLIAQAKEAVSDLEEPLKTEGFKTILAKLLESNSEEKKEEKVKKMPIKHQAFGKDSEIDKICSKINRTKFPKIYKVKNALGQALYILKIAREAVDNEGLLSLQISKILSSVFRIKTTPAAINMALGNAGTYVDRKPVKVQGGQGYKYILMHDGEEYLNKILENGKNK